MKFARVYFISFVAYGAIVVAGVWWAGRQSNDGPHAKLAHKIDAGDWIEDADLVPVDVSDIAKHYALRNMGVGDTITPADVTRIKQSPSKASLAIVVAYDRKKWAPLAPGGAVKLCLNGNAAVDSAQILANVCEADACQATIGLPEIPKSLQDKDAMAGVTLVKIKVDCVGN